jgi:hypothetical protein
LFQGRDLSKTLNIAVSSRALFDLKEEHDTFVKEGLDVYIKMQVEKENDVLLQGSAFPFIKVNMIIIIYHKSTAEKPCRQHPHQRNHRQIRVTGILAVWIWSAGFICNVGLDRSFAQRN